MSPVPAVLVGIPAVSWAYTEHFRAVERLLLPEGSEVVYTAGGCTPSEKRNALAERVAQDDRFGALFLLDSDMCPPAHTVARLLSHALPIVGALYLQRRPPFRPCAGYRNADGSFRFITEAGGPDPIQRVDYCGTGALLIQREVLQQLPRPWFRQHPERPDGDGSDVWFCEYAARAGIPTHVDTAWCVGHLEVMSIDLDFARAWWEAEERRQLQAAGVS